MLIRQIFFGAMPIMALGVQAQVVDLPGVHASATPEGCVNAGGSTDGGSLSYACLSRLVTADATPRAPELSGADVAKRPSNTLGLYNASALQNRMGPNLGTSAQPYRPKLVYPNPLGR